MNNTPNSPYPDGEQFSQAGPDPPNMRQDQSQQTNCQPQTNPSSGSQEQPPSESADFSGDTNSSGQMPNKYPNQSYGTTPYYYSGQYNAYGNTAPFANAPMPSREEKVSVGLAILSYIIPLAGLIIYCTKKNSRPKTAKVSGKCALASVVINVVISILIWVIVFSA